MTALTVRIRSFPRVPAADQVQVDVLVATGSEDLKTRTNVVLEGLEVDFLNTLVEDVVSTYMYGETTRDIVSAVAGVKKLARAHAQTHGF